LPTNFIALATFVLATVYSPGPANITAASMGALHGYRKTFPYLLGMFSGFVLVLLASGLASAFLLEALPALEQILRLGGALYILYLAFHTLRATYTQDDAAVPQRFGFSSGVLLQLLNPKAIIFGLTLYATFLSALTLRSPLLPLSAVLVAGVGLTATSVWTLTGATIRGCLANPFWLKAFNLTLSLLLVWIALELSGLLVALR
jgi:cysteine/O-acetylserine efflux protein